MSASRIASRNSSGPSKSCTRIITLPSPWATWLSEPAPGTIRYLAAKRSASSLKAVSATRGLKTSRMSISSTISQQVLVVGHRVQAVERVRDVDEPALAPDLGDRLLHRHPARDLLLEEEPDHLALLGRLHLLGDDHLDPPISSATSRAASAPEISLWSVIAIAPRPRSRAVASSTSTGVAQSGEWSVCMWRSTWIVAPPREPARGPRGCRAGRGGGRTAAGRSPRPGRRPRPSRGPRPRPARASSPRRPGSAISRSSWPARVIGVAGREQQPALAVAGQLLVERQAARRPGPSPDASALRTSPGAGRGPAGGDADDVGARDQLLGRRLARARRRGPGRAAAARPGPRPPSGSQTAASQSSSSGRRRSARRKSRSAPRSSSRQKAIRTGRSSAPCRVGARLPGPPALRPRGRLPARPARRCPGRSAPSAPSRRGSSPCARRAGRRRSRPAAAPPGWRACARSARGSCRRSASANGAARPRRRWARTGRGRGRCRARPRRAAPRAARLRSSGHRRARAAAARAASAGPMPTRQHRRAAVAAARSPSRSRRTAPPAARAQPRITRRDSRTAARELAGAATTTRCPRSASSAETRATNSFTSCARPPRMGAHLGDREALAGHRRSIEAHQRGPSEPAHAALRRRGLRLRP